MCVGQRKGVSPRMGRRFCWRVDRRIVMISGWDD